ncbi:MAG: SPFH domain-containing protein [Thiotrichaceae bacterium]|nr:SPFH domain-containing protein [Thiotrichaceae bacterium]
MSEPNTSTTTSPKTKAATHNSSWWVLGGVGGIVILLLAITLLLFKFETVEGNQIGVLETWIDGIDPNPYPTKTYFLFPGFSKKIYTYPLSLQVFVMNDRTDQQGETASGRERDSYLVQSSEGQDMHISLNVQWRIDPVKVIDIHKTVRTGIEEKMLRPVVMRVVKDQATRRTAIDAYSGVGLVQLQADIYTDLINPAGELRQRGIIVENFVIEGIRLDPKYIGEITERQVATQRKLKADEQTKAAQAEALRAEAEAQADLKKRIVEAERDKQVGILNAEKEAQQRILSAEAAKKQVILDAEAHQQKLVLEATGTRDAKLLEAQGILAIGQSEAEAQKLRLSAYAVPGADIFARVEIARWFASGHQNIKGYLPSDMNIYTLGSNFSNAVENLVGAGTLPPLKGTAAPVVIPKAPQ